MEHGRGQKYTILELVIMDWDIAARIFYKIGLTRRERRKTTSSRTEKAQRKYEEVVSYSRSPRLVLSFTVRGSKKGE